ncbi:MAG: M48 family metallopeptidase [Comamonadaceae bacterium]|nr:M48 family metallopeptidase [Comamonadaceae bacterium]
MSFTALFLAALAATPPMRLWLAARHIAPRASPPRRGAQPRSARRFRLRIAPEGRRLHRRPSVRVAAVRGRRRRRPAAGAARWAADCCSGCTTPGSRRSPPAAMPTASPSSPRVAVIGFLVDLPFSLYRTFVIENALRLQQA